MVLQVPKWSDRYKTGIRIIDNDHKHLFELTEALCSSAEQNEGPTQLGEIVDRLVNYANEHFVREEQFMAVCGFPGLDAHAKEHQRATEEIYGIRDLFRAQPDQLDPHKVAGFFARWLADHIQVRDQRYVPYVRGDESAMTEGPPRTAFGQASGTVGNMPLETVSVEVPGDKADRLRDCARILAAGGAAAKRLVDVLDEETTDDRSSHRLQGISRRYSR